ncbi:hypothetical protein [Roseiflexus castenholzii]|uniref:CRISPR-associated protein Cas5 family n=1 Tax=Roseiflexus castenholzii (strain DSM 13941 / HLO8) TaxID=383372 RepID=A7NI21_ROSCS|nr:hypothetical protein [Roseiflexus castenholzii]ABU57121.1 hypothetical protein Rcas_1013 [Roseiflexus castenholzii DSM 13941]
MLWLIARYQPTSLFSLKHSDATSTGGKSLLVPTPFAIRTALLDAAIRTAGVGIGPQAFNTIKSLRLAIRPPAHAAVTGALVKILKPERKAAARGRAMQQTITFREYVHLAGVLSLAFGGDEATLQAITPWLMQVNYFGKRGSFMQLLEQPTLQPELPSGFVPLSGNSTSFPVDGTLQLLDDYGPNLQFDQVNIYNDKTLKKTDRSRLCVVLPYRLERSARSFTLYKALDDA